MFDISPIQILIVLLVALLVLGPKRLPEMGRSLGRGARELRAAMSLSEAPPAPARERAAVPSRSQPTPQHEDDVLEGVVVPGDTPPGASPDPSER